MLLTTTFEYLNLIIAIMGIAISVLIAILVPIISWVFNTHTKVENFKNFEKRTEQTLEEIRTHIESTHEKEKKTLEEIVRIRTLLEKPHNP